MSNDVSHKIPSSDYRNRLFMWLLWSIFIISALIQQTLSPDFILFLEPTTMRQISTKFYWFFRVLISDVLALMSLFFARLPFFMLHLLLLSFFYLLRCWFHWSFCSPIFPGSEASPKFTIARFFFGDNWEKKKNKLINASSWFTVWNKGRKK